MKKSLALILSLVCITPMASAKTPVPLQSIAVSETIWDETPCRYSLFPQNSVKQCLIFTVGLPGDRVDVKQFKFDIPLKVQYQATKVAFILHLVANTDQQTHIQLAEDPRVPVAWIGTHPNDLYITQHQPMDVVYLSTDSAQTWVAQVVPSR